MVPERKMELEKETQSAYLQKDDGSDVMTGMKREIHRMQLRYSQVLGGLFCLYSRSLLPL
jgi:hypothetical protein